MKTIFLAFREVFLWVRSNASCRARSNSRMVFLLLSALLTSCVAAVVVGTVGGLVVYDRRSVTMLEKDARIFYLVHKEIARDPRFSDSHIIVSSFNQVVLLAGQTPLASLRSVAEAIAQKTPNVRRVHNEITLDKPLSLIQQSKDVWITSQVRSKMLTEKGLESGSIRVTTENKVVYLLGIVTPEQANLAVNVARHVKDVAKVVKVFQYIN